MSRPAPGPRTLLALVLVALCLGLGVGALPASAGVRLTGSSPAVGTQLDAPVTEAWLEFDEVIATTAVEARIAQGGTSRGHELEITAIGRRVMLSISPELGPGSYRIDWSVRTAEAASHGSVAFDVLATEGYEAPTGSEVVDGPTVVESSASASESEISAIDELTDRARSELTAERLRELGRAITTTAVLLAAGAVGFLVLGFRGSVAEASKQTRWVRLWAGVLLVGVVVERLGLHVAGADSWAVLLDGGRWLETASVRTFSLVLLTVGAAGMLTIAERSALQAHRHSTDARQLVGVAAGDPIGLGDRPQQPGGTVDERGWTFEWHGARLAAPAAAAGLLGLAILSTPEHMGLIGGWFRTIAMTLHLAAAAAWLGAAAASLFIITHRIVNREPVDMPRLAADSAPLTVGGLFGVVIAGVLLSMQFEGGSGAWSNAQWVDKKMLAVATAAGFWFLTRAILRRFGGDRHPFVRSVLRGGLTAEALLLLVAVLASVAAVA